MINTLFKLKCLEYCFLTFSYPGTDKKLVLLNMRVNNGLTKDRVNCPGFSCHWTWGQFLSWAHQNHNYLHSNHWWKRLEPTRKDLLQLKTYRRNKMSRRGGFSIESSPMPQVGNPDCCTGSPTGVGGLRLTSNTLTQQSCTRKTSP